MYGLGVGFRPLTASNCLSRLNLQIVNISTCSASFNTLLKEGAQASLSGTDQRVPVSCHLGTRQPYNCGKQLLISVSLDIVLLLFMCMHIKSPPSPHPGTKLYR